MGRQDAARAVLIAPELCASFLVLADVLSFTLAARQLYLSQPGLSRRISRLEDLLDTRLVDRTTRRVTLTPEGEELAAALRGCPDEDVDASRIDLDEPATVDLRTGALRSGNQTNGALRRTAG
jgi:Bacterial regulatory helix-turn-helix protein, lysR family